MSFNREAFDEVAARVLREQAPQGPWNLLGAVMVLEDGTYGPTCKYRGREGTECLQAASFLAVPGVVEVRVYLGPFVNLMDRYLVEGRPARKKKPLTGSHWLTREDFPVLEGERCTWEGKEWIAGFVSGQPRELMIRLDRPGEQELISRLPWKDGNPWIQGVRFWPRSGTPCDPPVLLNRPMTTSEQDD